MSLKSPHFGLWFNICLLEIMMLQRAQTSLPRRWWHSHPGVHSTLTSITKSSPVLFMLYTNGWANPPPITQRLKISDDTAIHDLLLRDQDASIYQIDQTVYWLVWCSPLHCECKDDWGNTHRSKVHRWPQYSFYEQHSCQTGHLLASTSTAHSRGMCTSILYVLSHNRGCIFWEGSDSVVQTVKYCFSFFF